MKLWSNKTGKLFVCCGSYFAQELKFVNLLLCGCKQFQRDEPMKKITHRVAGLSLQVDE